MRFCKWPLPGRIAFVILVASSAGADTILHHAKGRTAFPNTEGIFPLVPSKAGRDFDPGSSRGKPVYPRLKRGVGSQSQMLIAAPMSPLAVSLAEPHRWPLLPTLRAGREPPSLRNMALATRSELIISPEPVQPSGGQPPAQIAQVATEFRNEFSNLVVEEKELLRENTDLRKQLELVSVSIGTSTTDTASLGKTATIWIVVSALGVVAIFSLLVLQVVRMGDRDGDGDLDMVDVKLSIRDKFCCGLSWDAIKKVCLLFVLSAAGFAFLWWSGMIQPFLEEMVVYVYVLLVILSFIGVVLSEAWDDLFQMQRRIMEVVQNVQGFFDHGFQDMEEGLESYVCGAKPGKWNSKTSASRVGDCKSGGEAAATLEAMPPTAGRGRGNGQKGGNACCC